MVRRMKVPSTRVEEECADEAVPTPRTICWEKETVTCGATAVPVEAREYLSRCSFDVGQERCQKVALAMPKQVCYPAKKA